MDRRIAARRGLWSLPRVGDGRRCLRSLPQVGDGRKWGWLLVGFVILCTGQRAQAQDVAPEPQPPPEEWNQGAQAAPKPVTPPAPAVNVPNVRETTLGSAEAAAGCGRQRHPGLSEDPVGVGFFEADLGTGRRACPYSEVRIGGRGGAIIATSQFYGAIAADALISGSYSFGGKGEIFGTLTPVHFQYVQNATLKGTATQFGQLTLGGLLVALKYRDVTVSPYVRVMLPTASTPHVRTVGGEVGAAGDFRPLMVLAVHGYFGLDLSGGISSAPPQVRVGIGLSAGVTYAPATWFALAVDVQAHFNSVADLDVLAPALALRFRLYRGLSADLSAAIPVAGADRRLALALFSVGYRF